MRSKFVVPVLFAGLFLVVSGIFVVDGVEAGTWYTCNVTNVTPRAADGSTVIRLTPGTGETRFVDDPARGRILGTDTGANKELAVILTAISMGWEVTVELDSAPAWAIQNVLGIGLTIP